jgi:hypothetical protein
MIHFLLKQEIINSIALTTAPINTNIKMRSPFVSNTIRYPEIKQSPGPGDYNIEIKNQNEKESLGNLEPKPFGSSYK